MQEGGHLVDQCTDARGVGHVVRQPFRQGGFRRIVGLVLGFVVSTESAADALLEEKVARIDAAVAGAQARLDRVVSEARRPELEVKGPAPRGDAGGFADYMRSGFGLEVKAGLSTASNSATASSRAAIRSR